MLRLADLVERRGLLLREQWDPPAIGGDQQQRSDEHRDRDHRDEQRADRCRDHARLRCALKDDEAELAALREQEDEHRPLGQGQRHRARHRPQQRGFQQQERRDQQRDQAGPLQHHREVDAHADGDEEESKQQALERLDVGLELAPVLAFGEQHAGEERAERHRQPHRLHQRRGGDDEQQRRGGEDLRRVAARDPAERRAQQQAPAEHDRSDDPDRFRRAEPAAFARMRPESEQRDEREDRNRGHVLQQRDAQDALP